MTVVTVPRVTTARGGSPGSRIFGWRRVLALFDGGNDDRTQSFNEAMALSTASSVEVGSSGSPHQGDRLMALVRACVYALRVLGLL